MIQVIQLWRLFCVNGFFYFKFSPVLPESLSHCSGDRNIVDPRYITRPHNVIWLINSSFKILTFVYEPSRKTLGLLKALRSISRAADTHLCHTLFQGVQGTQYNLPTSGCPSEAWIWNPNFSRSSTSCHPFGKASHQRSSSFSSRILL